MSLEKLLSLQALDSEIGEIERAASVFPARLKEAREAEQKARRAAEALRAQLETLEREHRDAAATLELENQRLKKSQGRVKQLKTAYEFQALNREIENTKRSNADLEESILKKLEEIEAVRKTLAAAEEALETVAGQLRVVEEEASAKEAEFKGVLSAKAEAQRAAKAGIDPQLLAKYQFIQRRYRDALVQIIGGSCQGCHRAIPPQMHNTMLKTRAIESCPNCRRLMYVADA